MAPENFHAKLLMQQREYKQYVSTKSQFWLYIIYTKLLFLYVIRAKPLLCICAILSFQRSKEPIWKKSWMNNTTFFILANLIYLKLLSESESFQRGNLVHVRIHQLTVVTGTSQKLSLCTQLLFLMCCRPWSDVRRSYLGERELQTQRRLKRQWILDARLFGHWRWTS